MSNPTRRRVLEFRDLEDAVRDAELLSELGYERVGHWDLPQVCGHLVEWLRYPLDGYPKPYWVLVPLLWLVRHTIGPGQLRNALASGTLPEGTPTLASTIPAPGGAADAALEEFRATVARFQQHSGPYLPSPMFGPLDRDTATRLQLLHCAHHLSFLIPKDPP